MAMLLARTPDHAVDAVATPAPGDAEDLVAVRGDLVELAHAAEPVAPPARLRERLLATRPRVRRPERPVMIVLDMINDHLTPGLPLEVPRARGIVPALQARIAEMRGKGVPVIYVCDRHEADDPDYGIWPMHALAGTPGTDVIPELAPQPGDRVIPKPTYSAFQRSTLGPVLEELRADEIILTGCATELGLQATAVDALQRGFVVKIPPDCQAGVTAIAEQVTLLTLSTMPPYDPIYLRRGR
ncbi:Nicotinamidase [Minicystis rosea]|nr:Nicotinamidase [Minicystis rosea]